MKWIKEIDGHNFVGILDVVMDIKKEKNISPDKIVIPLLPTIVKFPQLMPADSIPLRDDYCSIRWKATEFLKKQGVIKDFELLEDYHRWGSRLKILLNGNEIDKVLLAMNKEYEKRKTVNQEAKEIKDSSFWQRLHPKVMEVSKSRFDSGHFADSVEAAFKEINDMVKSIVKQKTTKEYDGSDLMNRAFSVANPLIVLGDLTTESGKNIQQGYLQIFSGSIIGIRNPKAHSNMVIDEKRAIHFLHLASLLFYKIDEGTF